MIRTPQARRAATASGPLKHLGRRPELTPACSETPVRYNVSQEDSSLKTTAMVHVRIDETVKNKAAKTLAKMGMSVSDAVRLLLVRVATEKALPFSVKVPNATTIKAMQAADRGEGKRYNSTEDLFRDLGI